MSGQDSIKFTKKTPQETIFYGVLETLEIAARSDAGLEWPNGDVTRFSTNKEVVRSIPYTYSLPQTDQDESTSADAEEAPRQVTKTVEETSLYWFSGDHKLNHALGALATTYVLGLRVASETTVKDVPDHHMSEVFKYFLSAYPDAIEGSINAAGLEEDDFDTISEDDPGYKLTFMREAVEAILEATDEPFTIWQSVAYEVDETKMAIAHFMRQGYAVGDDDVTISQYDSSGTPATYYPVHGPDIDGRKKEFILFNPENTKEIKEYLEHFDADILLFQIDFSKIARRVSKKSSILAQPMHVYAKHILALLNQYKEPYNNC